MGNGIRRPEYELVIPDDFDVDGMVVCLDDVYHEYTRPGCEIRAIA